MIRGCFPSQTPEVFWAALKITLTAPQKPKEAKTGAILHEKRCIRDRIATEAQRHGEKHVRAMND